MISWGLAGHSGCRCAGFDVGGDGGLVGTDQRAAQEVVLGSWAIRIVNRLLADQTKKLAGLLYGRLCVVFDQDRLDTKTLGGGKIWSLIIKQ